MSPLGAKCIARYSPSTRHVLLPPSVFKRLIYLQPVVQARVPTLPLKPLPISDFSKHLHSPNNSTPFRHFFYFILLLMFIPLAGWIGRRAQDNRDYFFTCMKFKDKHLQVCSAVVVVVDDILLILFGAYFLSPSPLLFVRPRECLFLYILIIEKNMITIFLHACLSILTVAVFSFDVHIGGRCTPFACAHAHLGRTPAPNYRSFRASARVRACMRA